MARFLKTNPAYPILCSPHRLTIRSSATKRLGIFGVREVTRGAERGRYAIRKR